MRLARCSAREASADDDDSTLIVPATPARTRHSPRRLRGVHVAEVPGLRLVYDAVSALEERALLDALATDRGVAANNIHRATQWGWRFFTWNRTPPMSVADRLAPLPRWQRAVIASLEAADPRRDFLPRREEWGDGVAHALLNEYEVGDGVVAHVDDAGFWTSWVLGLSLGSDVTMLFHPPQEDIPPAAIDEREPPPQLPAVRVRLPARSLYVLTGDARWRWRHEIPRAEADVVDGESMPRAFRASITWRGIAPRWLPPADAGDGSE